jgi:hypothetical protein
MLNKRKASFWLLFTFMTLFIYADPADDIAKAGDNAWNSLIAQYKKDSRWTDPVSANTVVNNFLRYDKKIILFPAVDFSDLYTDPEGEKYYWYGDKNNMNVFLIKYNPGIQDKLNALNKAFGNIGGKYEVLAVIVDAWDLWGDVVLVDLIAVRVQKRACILIKDDVPILAGQDIFDRYMAGKAAN